MLLGAAEILHELHSEFEPRGKDPSRQIQAHYHGLKIDASLEI
jgi:hypothetical protein